MSAYDKYVNRLFQNGLQAPPVPAYRSPTQPLAAQMPDGSADLARGDLVAAAEKYQGGEGTRTERTKCPNCGSSSFFSRQNTNLLAPSGGGAPGKLITQRGTATVAPRCFECNYTGGAYDLSAM